MFSFVFTGTVSLIDEKMEDSRTEEVFFLLFILSISLQQNTSFFIFQWVFIQDQCYIFYIPYQLFVD